MTDIEQRIADETAAALRIHNMKQAAARLHDVRTELRSISVLLEGEAELTGIIAGIIVNPLENAMWKIETAIREAKA